MYKPDAIAALLRSMPKSYGNLVMAQMGRVGTLHETLSLLLEEKTKRNAKPYKGDSENYALYSEKKGPNPYKRPKKPNSLHFKNPN